MIVTLYCCRPIDIDNVWKCANGSLTKSEIVEDDDQAASIAIDRHKVAMMKEERLEVQVEEINVETKL